MWRRGVKECGVVALHGLWSDNITKTHVDLAGDARTVDKRLGANANSAVLDIFPGAAVRPPTSKTTPSSGTVLEHMAEKIQVSRRPKWIWNPYYEEQGALQNESIAICRYAEAIQQPFESVASEKDLIVRMLGSGAIEKFGPHRGADIAGFTLHGIRPFPHTDA